jgi:hypothetical protein
MSGHWQGYATQQSLHHAGCCHSFAFEKRCYTTDCPPMEWEEENVMLQHEETEQTTVV